MVSTPEGLTHNSTFSTGLSVPENNPSARKPLHQFYEVLDVKQKTDVFRLGDAKSNNKAITAGNML